MIFQNVAAVHSAGVFHHILYLNGRYLDAKVKCPIAVIIGDAKGNNSLCAQFNSSWSEQLYCECDTVFDETDNPYSLCHRVTQQRVQEIVMGGDRKGIEGLSFHNIENAFWNISFGANGYGIYQHCPPENLHSIKEGLFTYLLKGLVDQLSGKQKALAELDSLFKKYQSIANIRVIATFHA